MKMSNYSRQERRNKREKVRSRRRKGLWKKVLYILLGCFILICLVSGIVIASVIHSAPALEASHLETPLSTLIYDKDENLVDTVFREENRVNINIDDIPDEVKNAIISIEDKRFYDHHGIDYRRIFGAVAANIKNGWGVEGGSTITQQVIKQSVLTPEKTLTRKIQEAWLALKLERSYSKDQILEMYLNNIYFGHGAYGIKTAAKTYFDKDDLSELSTSQIALLVGLPNAPSANNPVKYPERAEKRRDLVLSAMANNDVISQQEAEDAKDNSVSDILTEDKKDPSTESPYIAFIDTVYEQLVNQEKIISEEEFYQSGLEIYTTLDAKAQQAVYDLLQSMDLPYPDENFETGIALVDTKTGAVQAVGGGRNFKAISYTNYGSKVRRDPGSTIKPILDYGPAIEFLNWSTAHVLSDEPYQYSDGTPINEWDNQYWGDVSMRRALEWSRNIPALKAFQEVGKDKAQSFAKDLGIDIDPIYESAAIGGFEEGASPLQMAEAYAAFGNGGSYNEPFTVTKIVFPNGEKWEPELNAQQVMQDYTAYMMTDMLKTVITSGTGVGANVENLPVAGKTGSTNIAKEISEQYGITGGVRDSWFVGYTPQHSIAVWTGYPSFKDENDDVQYIRDKETQDIAKQIFKELMIGISDPEMQDFEKPDSVIAIGSELYVRGTETHQERTETKQNKKEPAEEQKEKEPDKEQEDEQDEEQPDMELDEEETEPSGDKPDEKQEEEQENEQNGEETDQKQDDNSGEVEDEPDPKQEEEQSNKNDSEQKNEKTNDNGDDSS